MTTEQVLLEARLAVAAAESNAVMNGIIIVIVIAAFVLLFDYLVRRWAWIPRKRQRVLFGERF